MKLRHHPLISHHGAHSWPPTWLWVGGKENKHPRGEVGILKRVTPSITGDRDRFFLYIEYENSTYMGCLLIENPEFCHQVFATLQEHCGCSMKDVGSLELNQKP